MKWSMCKISISKSSIYVLIKMNDLQNCHALRLLSVFCLRGFLLSTIEMDYMQNVDAFNDFNISKHADQSVYMYVLFPHIGRCNQCPWTIQFQCQVCYSDHIKKGYPDSKTNQTHLKTGILVTQLKLLKPVSRLTLLYRCKDL